VGAGGSRLVDVRHIVIYVGEASAIRIVFYNVGAGGSRLVDVRYIVTYVGEASAMRIVFYNVCHEDNCVGEELK
jgi:hypothetical protein